MSRNKRRPPVSQQNKPVPTPERLPDYANAMIKGNRATDTISYEVALYRTKQDIARWRQATLSAETKHWPNRTEYYRLCKDVVLDTHLTSVMEQRITAVLAREVVLVDAAGEVNEEKTAMFKKSWFRKLLRMILEKRYYGFSMVDLGPLDDDTMTFPQIKLVPRQYVRPELNIVVPSTGSYTGIAIDDPKYKYWNPFFGEREDLGLLLKIAPLVIWKKGAIGYWSEYLEKFGMPLRVGKTDVKDDVLKSNMETALRTMGSAFWALMNSEDEFELIQSGINGAWENYDQMINRANSEVSKVVLTQTGTTDEKAYSGSSGVHADVFANIIEADVTDLEFDLNETMKPLLDWHGFAIDDLVFCIRYKETVNLKDKAVIDAAFMPYMKYNKAYLEDTYGIKIESVNESAPEPAGGTGAKKPADSATNLTNIIAEYSQSCPVCSGFVNEIDPFTDDEAQHIIEDIYEGHTTVYILPESMYVKTYEALLDGVASGYGTPAVGDTLLAQLTENIYVFSGAKTYQTVRDIQALLVKYPKRKDLFMKAAKTIFDDYNKTWLSTEVDNAHGSAIQARKWNEIERDKDILKFLEYQTAGDARVRPTHAALDGITRKVDDPFWSLYYPPNGWRCRCTTISHHDVAGVTPMKGFKAPDDVPPLFRMNVGKDGYIFKPDHPYFQVAPGDKDWAKKNFGLPLPE